MFEKLSEFWRDNWAIKMSNRGCHIKTTRLANGGGSIQGTSGSIFVWTKKVSVTIKENINDEQCEF